MLRKATREKGSRVIIPIGLTLEQESKIWSVTMNATSQTFDGVSCQIEQDEDAKSLTVPETPSKKEAKQNKKSEAGASDFALAQAAAGGEMAAFERLYERHHRRVYSLCLRMTQNPPEAEDLTQEVFIQLFRKIGSFRGESAFTTWLHRLTVNQVLMHFRKRSVKDEKTTEEGETPEQIVPGTEHYDRMPVVDRIALDKAIAQLPRGYRTIFVLHDVEGYEHEEIATMLTLSIGTSKSQLHKARRKLRDLLRQQNEAS